MRDQDPIAELISLLARLPGIGERTAARLAHFVLDTESNFAKNLGASLSSIHERVVRCERCGNYGVDTLCAICSDTRRDARLLCVVARVPDLSAIERSSRYHGRYHVLHGLLAPLEGVGPNQLPLNALISRIENEGVEEIVVATPLSVEGEATALYIAESVKPLNVRISRIASGIPHGGELEYTDQVTLSRALVERRAL